MGGAKDTPFRRIGEVVGRIAKGGAWAATPLFLALCAIELGDIVFALDSIPAVLSVSLDPFIVYTSNVFAILGLRAMYFALAAAVSRLYYLHFGLSLILVLVGRI